MSRRKVIVDGIAQWQDEGPSHVRLSQRVGGGHIEPIKSVSEARRAQLAEAQRRRREKEAGV